MRPLALLTLLLAAGCGPAQDAADPPETPPMANPPMGGDGPGSGAEAPRVPLPELLQLAEADPDALLARLGEPRRIGAEPVPNRHVPGQTDTLRTFAYDGVRVTVYDVAVGGRLVQEVAVTGEGYETAEGVGIGSTRADVREALGPPDAAEGDALVFERGAGPDAPAPPVLRVRFEGDRAVALTWAFYVD